MAPVHLRRLIAVVFVALVAFGAAFAIPHVAADGGSTSAAAPTSTGPGRTTTPADATTTTPAGATSDAGRATRQPVALRQLTRAPRPAPNPALPPAPTPAGVRRALPSLAGNPSVGGRVLSRVVDVTTGTVLFDDRGDTPAAPASTAKLLTAAAILAVRPPTYRFTTKVVDAGNGTIVLVGGGDPTLSAAKPGQPTIFPGAARISDLAAQVRRAHTRVKRIVVDDSLFSGPSVAPSWDPSDMGTSYGAPITAVMADAAQTSSNIYLARSTTPDLTAGADLARALGEPGLPVRRGRAPAGASPIASVRSATLAELLPEMLLESDNIIADVLARQVAVAERMPASFTGATAAIRTALARFGVRVGRGMKDGSGLSSADRVSPAALVDVLRLVGGAGPRSSAPLRLIASDLPVAGWSGTLADRFSAPGERVAWGRVRAKTGTLSTVSSLAGLVRDRSGRLLAFGFDADQVVGTVGTEAALDTVVTALARCGCD